MIVLKKTQCQGFVNGEGGTNTQPVGEEGSKQENCRGDWTTEGILEFVDVLNEGNENQAQRNPRHAGDTQQFIG